MFETLSRKKKSDNENSVKNAFDKIRQTLFYIVGRMALNLQTVLPLSSRPNAIWNTEQ